MYKIQPANPSLLMMWSRTANLISYLFSLSVKLVNTQLVIDGERKGGKFRGGKDSETEREKNRLGDHTAALL